MRNLLRTLLAMIALGAVLPALAADKPARFPLLSFDQLTPEQKPFAQAVLGFRSVVGLGGPWNTLLRSPGFGQKQYDLVTYSRDGSSLPRRLNEFMILVVGRAWDAPIEWMIHAPLALSAGVSQQTIDDIKAGRRPTAMPADEAAAYDLLTELLATRKVSDATFKKAKAALSERQLVDLTGLAGFYVTLAMLMNMAEEPMPPGQADPFKAP